MKPIKFLVLAAGVVGVVAFFLPLVAVTHNGVSGTLSARQMVFGVSSLEDLSAAGKLARGSAEEKQALEQLEQARKKLWPVAVGLFAPAVLLTLFGLIGAVRGRFARALGTGALLSGLGGIAVWVLLDTVANEAANELGTGDTRGVGMWLLMVCGFAGAIGGLLALIKPDTGEAASPRHAATIKA